MCDPVICADGNTYERRGILTHLKSCNTSPLDHVTVISKDVLIENRILRNQIEDFISSEECPTEMLREYQSNKEKSDPIKGEILFKEGKIVEAAKLGYGRAMGYMLKNYAYGKNGVDADPIKTFNYATQLATKEETPSNGTEFGHLYLGLCYYEGWGVEVDWKQAVTWLERCKNVCTEISAQHLGVIFYKGGHNVEKNLDKAGPYLRKAVDQGNLPSLYYLAKMYLSGGVFEQNFEEARKLFQKGAVKQFVNCEFELGKMIFKGQGGSQSNSEGMALIIASSNKVEEARDYLSRLREIE